MAYAVACVAVLATVGCSAEPRTPEVVAADVVIDIVANGSRLVVRNDRAHKILVLDTAMQPRREERSGTLTLTYVRPGTGESGDEPAIFEAAPVEAHGQTSIEPPFSLTKGDRLRFCLEVVDPAEGIGGDDTRVPDRDPAETAVLACSRPFTVR